MSLTNDQIRSLSALNIFAPGIYDGRTEKPYSEIASRMGLEKLIEIVQERVAKDGEWCIENGLVGDNEDKMRKMMDWASRREHIIQCFQYEGNSTMTVDWICRDLANGSRWSA